MSTSDSFWDSITWNNAIKAVGVLVLVYLVFKIFTPILDFKLYIDWWNQYDGGAYQNCIDMTALAYWEYFPLYYYMRNLTQSSTKKFESSSWVYFITSLIFGGAIGLVKDGTVSPRSICETLVPKYLPQGGKSWPTSVDCTDTCDKDPWGCWKCLLLSWGDVTITSDPKAYTINSAKWTSTNPDNFLFNDYAMPIDSPMIQGFLTNWAEDVNGQPLYPSAILPLLSKRAGLASGGWWGFLEQMGADVTYNELQRAVWAQVVPNSFGGGASAAKSCSGSASQASSIMGGLNLALGVGMVASGGLAVPAVLAAGAAGYVGTNAAKGCSPVPSCTIL